jgi:NADH-quinone oxidoreductase subunit C
MEEKKIAERVISTFPDAKFELIEEKSDHPFLVVPAERIVDVCRFLRDTADLRFDALSSLSSVDEGQTLLSVYHLFSYQHRHYCVLKVRVPRETPEVPSIQSIWPGAGWFEREAFDLMGIIYRGHDDLRRIMLPEDWVGHPLRKDYQEQEEYHGMGTSRNDPSQILALAEAEEKERARD